MIKTINFMYFWLNYSDKSNHLENILVALKNIDDLFCVASDLLESDKQYLLLLSDGTQINDN